MNSRKPKEIIFVIEESDEGGYEAKALSYRIYTEADDIKSLKENIKEAVECNFEKEDLPEMIHLHYVREETMSL